MGHEAKLQYKLLQGNGGILWDVGMSVELGSSFHLRRGRDCDLGPHGEDKTKSKDGRTYVKVPPIACLHAVGI